MLLAQQPWRLFKHRPRQEVRGLCPGLEHTNKDLSVSIKIYLCLIQSAPILAVNLDGSLHVERKTIHVSQVGVSRKYLQVPSDDELFLQEVHVLLHRLDWTLGFR